jgi:hypothetical protein
MTAAKMHQTTVRFSTELWQALEVEAAALGVSVAQYVREAALAQLAYSAGWRGSMASAAALGEAAAGPQDVVPPLRPAEVAREEALGHLEESTALWAQGRLARTRARELAERAGRLRGRQPAARPRA